MHISEIIQYSGEEQINIISADLAAFDFNYKRNDAEFPSGIYCYRLETKKFNSRKKNDSPEVSCHKNDYDLSPLLVLHKTPVFKRVSITKIDTQIDNQYKFLIKMRVN